MTLCQPPIRTYQLPAWQYTRHVPFWQIGSELPPTLGVDRFTASPYRYVSFSQPAQPGTIGEEGTNEDNYIEASIEKGDSGRSDLK